MVMELNILANEILGDISDFLSAYDLCKLVFTGDTVLISRLSRAVRRVSVEYTNYCKVSWPNFVSRLHGLKHLSVDVGSDTRVQALVSVSNVSYSSLPRGLESLSVRFENAATSLRDFMLSSRLSGETPSSLDSTSSNEPQSTYALDGLALHFPKLKSLVCHRIHALVPRPIPSIAISSLPASISFIYPETLTSLSLGVEFVFSAKNLRSLPSSLLTLSMCFERKIKSLDGNEPDESVEGQSATASTGVTAIGGSSTQFQSPDNGREVGLTFPPNLTDLTMMGGPPTHAHFRYLPRSLTKLQHINTPIINDAHLLFDHLPRALTQLTLNISSIDGEQASLLPRGLLYLTLSSCGSDSHLFAYNPSSSTVSLARSSSDARREAEGASQHLDASYSSYSESHGYDHLGTEFQQGQLSHLFPRLKLYSDSRVRGNFTDQPDFALQLPRTLTSLPMHWTNHVAPENWQDLPPGLTQLTVRGYRFIDHTLSSRLPLGLRLLTIYLPTQLLLENLSCIHITKLILGDAADLILQPSWLNPLQSLVDLELGSGVQVDLPDFANFTPKLESLDMGYGGALHDVDWTSPWTQRLATLRFKLTPTNDLDSSEKVPQWEIEERRKSGGKCLPSSITKLHLYHTPHCFFYSTDMLLLPRKLKTLFISSIGLNGPISDCLTKLPPTLVEMSISALVPKEEALDLTVPLDFALHLPPNLTSLTFPNKPFKGTGLHFPMSFQHEDLKRVHPYLDMYASDQRQNK